MPGSAPSTDTRLANLLMQWEDAAEGGCPVSLEELCADWPEGLEELRRRIKLLEALAPALDLTDQTVALTGATSSGGRPRAPALPNFELLEVLGRGGMGVVYKARQKSLDRFVAVKVMRPGIGLMSQAVQRFAREAHVLAQLRHDHIVPIYEAELHRGRPYFVMEYVPGGCLAERVNDFTGSPKKAARLVEQVARAVAAAHSRGVMHRDLKPANILLDEAGKPLVSDFGLAKLFDREPSKPSDRDADTRTDSAADDLTSPGPRPGTPPYMAPEQHRGGPDTFQTDVWALGVILYELLTGRRPFPVGDRQDLAASICQDTPPRPRTIKRQLDRSLEAICLKCLAKEPADRYPSAAEVADDLERWQRGEAISIRPDGWFGRIGRGVRRRPTPAVAAVLLAAFGLFLALAEWRPPGWDEALYRLAVKRSQQELARGHPVEVIGPETRRLPHRWRYGHGTVEYPAETDGAVVRIFSLEPSLVELLPGLRAPAYQVEAVLCHQASYNPFADVGVYVAHAQYTTADGPQHFFVKGRFAELGSQALAVQGPDGQFGGEFKLDLWHLGTTPGEPYRASYTYKPGIFFRPKHPRRSPGEWQTVRVEVRRDVFRLIWEGKDLTISRDREVPQWIEGLKNHYPDLTGFDLQLPAHGALGIYLHGSSVLVRRLTVTPLETDG